MRSILPALPLLFTSLASAGVVYTQPVVGDPALVGRGWFSHSAPRPTRNFKHADDFVLDSDATIGSVRWWGLSEGRFDDGLTNFDSFTIEFFTAADGDNGPIPAALLATQTFSLHETDPTATGRTNAANGAIEYLHGVGLAAPVELLAGQTYFIAISAGSIAGLRDGWMWSDADGSDRYSVSYSWASGAWTGFIDTDSAFELSAVPSPGTLLLLAPVALVRRRR